jgi:putative spermidine/putrescine transport system permease protein
MRFDSPSWVTRIGAFAGLAFMHIPVLVIILYAFTTEDRTYQFPPPGLTLKWFEVAFGRPDIWQSLTLSLGVAACATTLAMILGTLAAFALARSTFRGRDALTVLFVLPIALPGIVTGIALLAAMTLGGIEPSFFTIVAGHATFCLVIVYNNVVARLRRLPANWVEASMDLGADGSQTLRYVLLPQVATAFLAGGMLAFALSFDEIIVTIFTAGAGTQTIPLWIFSAIQRPNELPVVNVVALVLVLLSIVPVYIAQRLSADTSSSAGL